MLADLAIRHLALRLRPVNRALGAAVQRQAALAARLARPDITHLCITDDQVQVLLRDADALLDGADAQEGVAASEEDLALELGLRSEAKAAGAELPLDALARLQGLSTFDQQALLLCAAPEIERGYERIFGYVLDDMNRRGACIELLCALGGDGLRQRLTDRLALGPHGKLRRTGMLRTWGEAYSEMRQELRLGTGMLDCLCGAGTPEAFRDPAEVSCVAAPPPPGEATQFVRAARGVRDGAIAIVGIWGPARSGHAEAAQAIAVAAGKPLRRFVTASDVPAALHAAIGAAAVLGAILWIPTEAFGEEAGAPLRQQLAAILATSPAPIVLTGATAWRPVSLLAERPYAEIRIAAPDHGERRDLWSRALPHAAPAQLTDLAGRYRVGATEVRAAALAAQSAAQLAGPGVGAEQHVDAACAAVLRPAGQRFTMLVEPRRGPADLILPPSLHRQVMEVAAFFRAWPRVAADWGFDRTMAGRGGIKALFAGDSGTGKTLAAEVVAGKLGMPLLKIDLAQIVSKWIGETEKHLESVFAEAEDSHGVLFFDEADALFGKRGEVQHGVDRYANLEVSYLLQRIEDYAGLVILATNLHDNIDVAFTRRFHVVLKFPRPQAPERRRIWEIAFPDRTALEADVDLDQLARLDLTGAGITSVARTAALLAASAGRDAIGKPDIVPAIARQYQLEARVLIPSELGAYAHYLPAAP